MLGILHRLFIKYIQAGQFDEAIQIKRECDEAGVYETPAILSSLLTLWNKTKDADKGLQVIQNLQENHPNATIPVYKVINLAELLVSTDRLEEAKMLIKHFDCYKKTNILPVSCMLYLLKAARDYSMRHNKKENIAQQFSKLLTEKGHCKYSNELSSVIVLEYIDKKEIFQALAFFENCAKIFKKTPQVRGLLTVLINLSCGEENSMFDISPKQADECLQRMITVLKQIHGIENANSEVIKTFAVIGKEQHLRQILMNPKIKCNSKHLLNGLIFLKGITRISATVAIGRCSRGLQHESLTEENLYEFILDDYVHSDDFDSARQFYEEILKDEKSFISKKFCKTLAKLLAKNNQSIPDELKSYCE